MNKYARASLLLIICALLPSIAYAGVGVGVEYAGNIGPDLVPAVDRLHAALYTLPSGAIQELGAFGYRISPGGWRIGGFLVFFNAGALDLLVPDNGEPATSAFGGYGGVLSGGQGRLGPFRLSLNIRAGVGGAGLGYTDRTQGASMTAQDFGLFGAADGEIGLLFVPEMLVSVYAGIQGMVLASDNNRTGAGGAFVAGVRVAWGSF